MRNLKRGDAPDIFSVSKNFGWIFLKGPFEIIIILMSLKCKMAAAGGYQTYSQVRFDLSQDNGTVRSEHARSVGSVASSRIQLSWFSVEEVQHSLHHEEEPCRACRVTPTHWFRRKKLKEHNLVRELNALPSFMLGWFSIKPMKKRWLG